jgi:uncharacterized protein YbaR (Trm112 family)
MDPFVKQRIQIIKTKIGALSPGKRGELACLSRNCFSLINDDIPFLLEILAPLIEGPKESESSVVLGDLHASIMSDKVKKT